MKANEIMIGDLVSYRGIVNRVAPADFCQKAWIEEIKPIPLTTEILEKNGFKKDAFTNLSPDFYFKNDICSIYVNLNSTCEKSKEIFVENRQSKHTISFIESKNALPKKDLYVHQLQHALRLCGIEKTIEL